MAALGQGDQDQDDQTIVSESQLLKVTDVQPQTEARLAEVQIETEDRSTEYLELYNALDIPGQTAFLNYLLTFDRAMGLKMLEKIANVY